MKVNYIKGNRLKFARQINQGELFIGQSPFIKGAIYMRTDTGENEDFFNAVQLDNGSLFTALLSDEAAFETVVGELTIFE